jgi:hypothetical protein
MDDRKQYSIFQAILNLTHKDNTLAVDGYTFDELKFHNEFKGETRHEQIKKWQNTILVVYGIQSAYDPKTGFWYFEHKNRAMYVELMKPIATNKA